MQATIKDKFLLLLVIIVGLASIGRHQWSLRSFASSGTKQALDGLVVVHNKNDRRIQNTTKRTTNNGNQPFFPFCNRTQIQHGQWIQQVLPHAPYRSKYDQICNNYQIINGSRHWVDYEWQPTDHPTCNFDHWNASLFCQLTYNAPILILGDSLSWEHYVALVERYVTNFGNGQRHVTIQLQSRTELVVQSICDGATPVAFHRTDGLEDLNTTIFQDFFPTILILNRGAHYVPDDRLRRELQSTFHVVKEWLRTCQQEYGLTCHFYWRTTVPGHYDCKNFSGPVNNLTSMEEWVTNTNKSSNHQAAAAYHWQDFQRQNKMVEEMLESTFSTYQEPSSLSRPPYRILDAYYLNLLRPDGHLREGDCLHSCAPGKVSVYNRLLLHWLRMDRTIQDVQQLAVYAARDPTWMNRSESKFP